jgi:hypothetical protein
VGHEEIIFPIGAGLPDDFGHPQTPENGAQYKGDKKYERPEIRPAFWLIIHATSVLFHQAAAKRNRHFSAGGKRNVSARQERRRQ